LSVEDAVTTPLEIVIPGTVVESVYVYGPTPPVDVKAVELSDLPKVVEIFDPPATVTAFGVAVIEVDESEFPTVLTALIRTWYEVPLVKPEIVSGVEVSTGERAVQFEPLFVDH
jgi:hypothetical protein